MNQFDIEDALDKLEKQGQSKVDKVFNNRLKELLAQVSELMRKYGGTENSIWTEVNRYNRFKKELALIEKEMGANYKEVIEELEKLNRDLYMTKYLMYGYLITQFVGEDEDVGFSLPPKSVIDKALINPVELLTLPKVLERDRNDAIYRISVALTEGLIAGESYAKVAKRLENAVGINRRKALATARTEGSRVRAQASIDLEESEVGQRVKLKKVWLSSLDLRVRASHRKLDGQVADKDGYFHYHGYKAKGPSLWPLAELSINCRCSTILLVNDKLPSVRRGRDYNNADYQKKLRDRVDKYTEEGLRLGQAIYKADKEIQPPSVTIPYVTFNTWKEQYT